jgi:hypothetical protein
MPLLETGGETLRSCFLPFEDNMPENVPWYIAWRSRECVDEADSILLGLPADLSPDIVCARSQSRSQSRPLERSRA